MIGSATFYININSLEFNIISLIGLVIWIIGYYFEVVGDKQLRDHIKNPAMKGKLLTTGLWSKTRHPNYFGEAFMWWGIFLFALLNNVPVYYIISPLTISIVLYFISTPILEAKMQEREEWESYAKVTPMFFPLKFSKK